jgi:hypothetical protein
VPRFQELQQVIEILSVSRNSTVFQHIAGRLPGPHSSVYLQNIGVTQRRQRFGRRRAHAATAAIEDNGGILVWQIVQVVRNLVKRNEHVGLRDLPFVGNVDID